MPFPFHRGPRVRHLLASTCIALLAACYPAYDWRDYRPDCARFYCGFTASFPGRVTSAARDIPIDGRGVPLALHVVSARDLTFAIGVFDLAGGVDRAAAQARFEAKLLDDVGAAEGRSTRLVLQTTGREPLDAVGFEAGGSHQGQALQATARFVQRRDKLIEAVVIGPAQVATSASGIQAIETFFTSIRVD